MAAPSQHPARGRLYWLLVAALLAFGFLGILSIGAPFLLLGVTLTVLSPFRHKPSIFWPGLGLVGGFLRVRPDRTLLMQSERRVPTLTEDAVTSPVLCRSLLGIEYSGPDNFQPSRTPGLVAGVITGVLGAIGAWVKVRSRGARSQS